MERHILSKSTFIRGVQCLKSLYLYKKRYFLRDKLSQEQQAVFSRGTNVGVLARQLFPGGKDASPSSPFLYARSVALTAEWIKNGEKVIYEAAFQYDKILVMLDILVHTPDGWIGIEVKSSRSVSETYLLDAALQYYVITGSGLPLADIRIVHINGEYIRSGGLELDKLFTTRSVLDEVLSKQDFIQEQIIREKEIILLPHEPSIPVGLHCHNPYPCDFIGHCWKNIPRPSVFDLDTFSPQEQQILFNDGFHSIGELSGLADLSPHQQIELNSHLRGELFLNKEALTAFVRLIESPFLYLKILYCHPALPLYSGTRPYEYLPYAFSVLSGEQGATPVIFIAPPGTDPRIAFSEKLKAEVGDSRTILVSGQGADVIFGLNQSLFQPQVIDLFEPFKNYSIYRPGQFTGMSIAEITGYSGNNPEVDSIQSDTMAGVRYLSLADALEGDAYNMELAEIGRYAGQCVAEIAALHNWLSEMADE